MSKPQTAAMMHEAVDQALERKRADLSATKAELYAETVRYLTLVQIDNLWAQQLEVRRGGAEGGGEGGAS